MDLNVANWNKISGNISSICSDSWSFSDKLSEDTQDKPPKKWNLEKIQIVERIGTESSQGEVYRLRIGDFEFAGKILPIISDNSIEDNENEIAIAKELSKEVTDGRTIYFPIVYASALCDNTIFSKNSLFYEDSYRYNYRSSLYNVLCQRENMNSACKKRMIHKYKSLSLEELKKIHPENIHISSHVLMSEICFSDLREYASEYTREYSLQIEKDESFWVSIIAHVMKGIKYLNEKMNIIHNDLHTGNILIKIVDNNDCLTNHLTYQPLIHDFGKSRRIQCWTMYDRVTDIGKFIHDLKLNPNISNTIKAKCEKIFRFIDSIKTDLTSRPIIDEIIQMFLFS